MTTCQVSVETWGPHPGCAEFMTQPDVWNCPDAAVVRFTYWDAFYVAISGDPDGDGEMLVCAAHAVEERAELDNRAELGEIRDLAEQELAVTA